MNFVRRTGRALPGASSAAGPAGFRTRLLLGLIGAIVAACLIGFGWLGTRVIDELASLRSAPRDNVQWSASQLETEAMRMHLAAVTAASGDAQAVAEFRRRFDIFYSRVEVLRTGAMFARMRDAPEIAQGLDRLVGFLDETAAVVDGPPGTLEAALPGLTERTAWTLRVARDLALAAVARFAQASDRERVEFTNLLLLTSVFALSAIVVLLLTALVLVRQILAAHRSEAETRRSEARLSAMINSALDAVIVVDRFGAIIEYNSAARTIFGFAPDEAIGAPMAGLIIPERHRAAHREGFKRFLETGETRIIGKGRVELTALDATGREFPVELTLGKSIGEDGPIFIAYLRDITRRKQAEDTLRLARDRAEAADRAKSDFLAVMSHEMRTPLSGVLGAVDLLRSTELDDKQARYVGLAEKSGEILQQHIADVLDLTKIESGQIEIVPAPFDPAGLVEELAEVTREEALKRDNQISVRLGPGIPLAVSGDPHRVRQILLNFVANAIKFTSEGEITIGLDTAPGSGAPDLLEFSVTDTGIGIAEADQARLFDEFVVLDPSYTRNVGGTGLGLAICRRLSQAMGGEIGVESTPGEGSRFWVRLPLPMTEAEPAQAEPAAPAGVTGLRVLLVDDNETNRIVGSELLTKAGHSVSLARDGAEAVERAHAAEYDLILMDVSMPRMDGVEATKQIRRGDGRSRAVPVIAVTAHARSDELDRFLAAGMQGVLNKPVRAEEMLRILAEAPAHERSSTGKQPAPEHSSTRNEPMTDEMATDLPVFDMEAVDSLRAALRPGRFERALEGFRSELTKAMTAVAAAAEAGDHDAVRRDVHRIAGAAASIAATRLAWHANHVETLIVSGGQASRRDVKAFTEAAEKTMQAMDQMSQSHAVRVGAASNPGLGERS